MVSHSMVTKHPLNKRCLIVVWCDEWCKIGFMKCNLDLTTVDEYWTLDIGCFKTKVFSPLVSPIIPSLEQCGSYNFLPYVETPVIFFMAVSPTLFLITYVTPVGYRTPHHATWNFQIQCDEIVLIELLHGGLRVLPCHSENAAGRKWLLWATEHLSQCIQYISLLTQWSTVSFI